jgi:adenylylsulfate kinase
MNSSRDIFPNHDAGVSRFAKEQRMNQRGAVVWLFGLSGAGKSTLAAALEHRLAAEGRLTALLDGDNLRSGLNRGLGFSDADRSENLRRAAEVARLLAANGLAVICAFITPLRAHRQMIRGIVKEDDLLSVHVAASLAICEKRDPKGLYARAAQGMVKQFTGKDSGFEAPLPEEQVASLDTERTSVETALVQLHGLVAPRLMLR